MVNPTTDQRRYGKRYGTASHPGQTRVGSSSGTVAAFLQQSQPRAPDKDVGHDQSDGNSRIYFWKLDPIKIGFALDTFQIT